MIKSWIKTRIIELLGFEDELVVNLAIHQLENSDINNPLCPKKMQINLTGFLEGNASIFMKELWNLLLISQSTEGGIVYSQTSFLNRPPTSSKPKRPNSSKRNKKSRRKSSAWRVFAKPSAPTSPRSKSKPISRPLPPIMPDPVLPKHLHVPTQRHNRTQEPTRIFSLY